MVLPPVLSPTTAGFLPPLGSAFGKEGTPPTPPSPRRGGREAEMGLMEGRPQPVWEEDDAPPRHGSCSEEEEALGEWDSHLRFWGSKLLKWVYPWGGFLTVA